MISLPASTTTATVPSGKQARKERGAFPRGQRARIASRGGEPGVPAFLHALLRQVEPYPAAVLSPRWDILAFNRGYDALFGLESVPVRSRNAMLLYFAGAGQRGLWPDWAADAPRVVSQIRAAMARHDADPEWATLLERLRRASADFDRMWQETVTVSHDNAPERFQHPVAGALRLTRFRLWAEPRDDGLVAVGYTPADAATAAKLPRPCPPSPRKHDRGRGALHHRPAGRLFHACLSTRVAMSQVVPAPVPADAAGVAPWPTGWSSTSSSISGVGATLTRPA